MLFSQWLDLILIVDCVFLFQFRCDTCLQSFHSQARMKSHHIMCTFCPKCKRFMDKRHLEKCTGKVPKNPQVLCNLCDRMKGKATMARHMKTVHGQKDWKASDHPDVMSEVIRFYCFLYIYFLIVCLIIVC